jgi:uncharacterized protein
MVDGSAAAPLRSRLRTALLAALKTRDSIAISAFRSAQAAIDNAEAADPSAAPAPQLGTIAGGVAGLGAGEVARRRLCTEEVVAIIRAEIDERRLAALDYERGGRDDAATRRRAEADVLARFLDAGAAP